MKLPGFKRFQTQDFPKKYSDLTVILFNILNPFMELITQALTKRLNFDDNFDCYDVTLDLLMPLPSNGFKLSNPRGGVFKAAQVLYCINKNNPTEALTGAPFVQFTTSSDGQILITNITGLTTGKTYTIRTIFFR